VTNKSKQTGTRWETWVRSWLNEHGHPHARRTALAGALDEGDVHLYSHDRLVVLEAKDVKTITLAQFLKEIRAEIQNADAWVGAAVIKQRGHGPQDAYVLVPMECFLELIK
jgi:hypothetical protein